MAATTGEPGWATTMLGTLASSAVRDADVLEELCHVCAAAMPVSGAAITLMPGPDVRGVGVASSPLGVRIDDLQWTLGEGPCVEAVRTGRPVLVPDLGPPERHPSWTMFAAAAVEAGVRAVFALPMQLGAITIGALELYRDAPGSLPMEALREALIAAEGAALLLLGMRDAPEGRPDWSDRAWVGRAEVHQAAGMVMVQLGVPAAEALIRLRAFAFSQGRTITEVARDVVARSIRFDGMGS